MYLLAIPHTTEYFKIGNENFVVKKVLLTKKGSILRPLDDKKTHKLHVHQEETTHNGSDRLDPLEVDQGNFYIKDMNSEKIKKWTKYLISFKTFDQEHLSK